MPQLTTNAVVLHTYPYGETSKIVRLATPGHGVLSAVARGAHRARSGFGAKLQALSEGAAHLYVKANRDLHTLAGFDVERQRTGLARDLDRYAAAAALAEIVLRCSPHEPHPEAFELLRHALDALDDVEAQRVESVALMALWRMVAVLGVAPSMDACAVDGEPIPPGSGPFSVVEGGLLCARCAGTRRTSSLPAADRVALASFIAGTVPDPTPPPRHLVAHRRLLLRWVRGHLAEHRELPAVTMWEART